MTDLECFATIWVVIAILIVAQVLMCYDNHIRDLKKREG